MSCDHTAVIKQCPTQQQPPKPPQLHLHQWKSTSRPLLLFKLHLHQWSTSRPFQPCTRHQRLLWSPSRLLLLCTRHKRQVWCLLHPRQFCPHRQRQVSISHLRQLCFVLGVFKALSQDRVPPLVVDMIFLSLLGGDALRMRLAVCTFGMCTRARRDGHLQCRRTRLRMRRTRRMTRTSTRRTKTWTRSMLSLLFPLGSYPCGCAGGSPPGTAGRGGCVCSLTR